MEHVTIKIETGNTAFNDKPATEVARILRHLAEQFEREGDASPVILDANGKFCGEVQILTSDE